MAERIVLDPVEVATDRTEVDITTWIKWEGADWGDAAIEQYLAEAQRGQLPVDHRVPNRTVTIPLVLKGDDFVTARDNLQAKAALFQAEGGWIKRETDLGPLYADVTGATLKLGGSTTQAFLGYDTDAALTLECLPDWYGDEIELEDHVESTGQATLTNHVKNPSFELAFDPLWAASISANVSSGSYDLSTDWSTSGATSIRFQATHANNSNSGYLEAHTGTGTTACRSPRTPTTRWRES